MPFPLFAGLVIGGGLLLRRGHRAGRGMIIAGLVLLTLASNNGIGSWAVGTLESRHGPITGDVKLTDPVIAVLGSGHFAAPNWPATQRLRESSSPRVVEAVRLSREWPDAPLLLCGATDRDRDPHPAVLAQAVQELGVAPARLEALAPAYDTHDEVNRLRERIGDRPVLLITTAWHMPRAMALARKADLHAVACPAGFLTAPADTSVGNWFKFSPGGLQNTTFAAREYLGFAWAKLRGLI